MKTEEINIKLATIRGWKHRPDLDREYPWVNPEGFRYETGKAHRNIPDYCNNLNECHDLMQWIGGNLMDADKWELFGKELLKLHPSSTLLEQDGKIDYYDLATFVSDLTSRQICEALLRTLGLFID